MTNCCIKKKCARNCEDCKTHHSSCKPCKSKSSSYFCKPKCCSEHKKRKKKPKRKCKTHTHLKKCVETRCKHRPRKCDKIAVVQLDKSNCCIQNNLESGQFDLGGRRTGRSVYFAKYRKKQLDCLDQELENQQVAFKPKYIDEEIATDNSLYATPKNIPDANVFLRRGSSRSRYSYKSPQCCSKPKPKKPISKKNKKIQKQEKCSKKRCDRYLTLSRYYKGQFRPYYDPAPKCETDSGISLKPKSSAFSRARSEPRKIKYTVPESRSQEFRGRSLSAPAKSTSPTTNFHNEYDVSSMTESTCSSDDEEFAYPRRSRAGSDVKTHRRHHYPSQATDCSQSGSLQDLQNVRPASDRESSSSNFKQCPKSTTKIPMTFQNTFEPSTKARYYKRRSNPYENKSETLLAIDAKNRVISTSREDTNVSSPTSNKQGSKSKYFKKYCLLTKKIKNVIKRRCRVKSSKRETKRLRKNKIDCQIQAGYKTIETCSSTPRCSNRNNPRIANRITCCKSNKHPERIIILSDTSLGQISPCGPTEKRVHNHKNQEGVNVHISRRKYRPYNSNVALESTDQLANDESSANFFVSPNQHRRVTYDQPLNSDSCVIKLSDDCRIRAGSSERRSAGSDKFKEDKNLNRRNKSKNRRYQKYCPEDDEYSPRFSRMGHYIGPYQMDRKTKRRNANENERRRVSSRSNDRSLRSQTNFDLENERHHRKPQPCNYRNVPDMVTPRYRPDRHPHQTVPSNESCSGSSTSIVKERDRYNKKVKICSENSVDSIHNHEDNYDGARKRCCSERGQLHSRRTGGSCPSNDNPKKYMYVCCSSQLRKEKEGFDAPTCKKRMHREEGLPVTIIVNPYVKGSKQNPLENDNFHDTKVIKCCQKKCRSCGKPMTCSACLQSNPNNQRSKSCASKKKPTRKSQKGALYAAGSTEIIINRSESSIDIYRVESDNSMQFERSKCRSREPITDSYDSIRNRNPCCRDRCTDAQCYGKSKYFSKNRKNNATQVAPPTTDSRNKYVKCKSCRAKKRLDNCGPSCPAKRPSNNCWYDDYNQSMYNRSYHVGYSTCSYDDQPLPSKCSLLMSSSTLNSLDGLFKRKTCEKSPKKERCSIINDPKRREKKLRSRYLDRNSRASTHYQQRDPSNSDVDAERNDCEIPPQIGHSLGRQTIPKKSTYKDYWDGKMNDISKCMASVSSTARKVSKWEPEPKLVKYWCECCETFVRPKKKVKRTLFTECVTSMLQCCVPQLKVHVTAYVCPKCQNTLIKFVPENKSAVKGCINKNTN